MKTGETYNLRKKKQSSCSNQNLYGSMDTKDNGGILNNRNSIMWNHLSLLLGCHFYESALF